MSGDAQEFWDAIYRGRDPSRPGRPHSYVVEQVAGASPTTAPDDGEELAVDALHVLAPMAPRDDLAARLGIATTELPNGTGIAAANTFGTTSVPGVFAAGDAAGAGNVAAAIAGGSLAATGLHRTLVAGQAR